MLNFTFTFWVNIYTMIAREEVTGEGKRQLAVESSLSLSLSASPSRRLIRLLSSKSHLPTLV